MLTHAPIVGKKLNVSIVRSYTIGYHSQNNGDDEMNCLLCDREIDYLGICKQCDEMTELLDEEETRRLNEVINHRAMMEMVQ